MLCAGQACESVAFDRMIEPRMAFLEYIIFKLNLSRYKIMDFGRALSSMKGGCSVARTGWNGKGMWLRIQFPDDNSKMTLPYVYIEYPVGHQAYPEGSKVPWLASQTDLLSEDWIE